MDKFLNVHKFQKMISETGENMELQNDETENELQLESAAILMQQQEQFASKIMKQNLEIIKKEAEVNQLENKTIIIGLKEEISKYQAEIDELTKQNNDLQLQAKESNSNALLSESKLKTLEKRIINEFGVESIEKGFESLQHLFRCQRELESAKIVIQKLQIELSSEKIKPTKNQIEPKRAENAELIHKMQLTSDKISDYEAQIKTQSDEILNLQKELAAAQTQNQKLSELNNTLSEQCKLLKSELNQTKFDFEQSSAEITNLNDRIRTMIDEHSVELKNRKMESINEHRRLKLIDSIGDRCEPSFAALDVASPLYDLFRKLSSFLKVSSNVSINNEILQGSFTDLLSEIRSVADRSRGYQNGFAPNVQQLINTIEEKNKEISELKEENEDLKSRSDFLEQNDVSPNYAAALKKIQRLETENKSLSSMNQSLRSMSLSPRSPSSKVLF